jgi:hypothetical protein
LKDFTVHWRRWTGWFSAAGILGFAGLLIALVADPAFWQGAGADLRLILLLMIFALIANAFLRRAVAVYRRKPAITVGDRGLLLSDGLAERFLPWTDIERLRLTRSRLAIDLRPGSEGRALWQFSAQLLVAPALRYLYFAVDFDKRGFYETVRARTPEYFRIELSN